MKLFIQSLILCVFLTSAQAVVYTYVEEGVSLPLDKQNATIYSGIPVEVISEDGDFSKVVFSGYVDNGDKKKLYATPNLKLLLATVNNESSIKVSGNKGILQVTMSKDNLTTDSEEAWDISAERFYEKCTQCHAAKVVEEHTMLEWEGLYGSMKEFAKPTKEDTTYILRFLRAYSKDGIVKEVQ